MLAGGSAVRPSLEQMTSEMENIYQYLNHSTNITSFKILFKLQNCCSFQISLPSYTVDFLCFPSQIIIPAKSPADLYRVKANITKYPQMQQKRANGGNELFADLWFIYAPYVHTYLMMQFHKHLILPSALMFAVD